MLGIKLTSLACLNPRSHADSFDASVADGTGGGGKSGSIIGGPICNEIIQISEPENYIWMEWTSQIREISDQQRVKILKFWKQKMNK